MNNKVHNVIKATKGFVSKHSPEILTGLGVASMITSTVFAVKATPKAIKLIEEEEKRQEKEVNLWEKTKLTWKNGYLLFLSA